MSTMMELRWWKARHPMFALPSPSAPVPSCATGCEPSSSASIARDAGRAPETCSPAAALGLADAVVRAREVTRVYGEGDARVVGRGQKRGGGGRLDDAQKADGQP